MLKHSWLVCGCLLLGAGVYGQVALVENGEARAVIVIPREPLPVVTYAAQELRYHVGKATGADLAVVREDVAPAEPATRVYLGACDASAETLKTHPGPDAFVRRAAGGHLFISGGDGDGPALDGSTHAGTLFGVYDLLDTVVGVRWLWPGELGEVVPACRDIIVPAVDVQWTPQLLQRNLRTTLRGTWRKAYSRDAFRQVRHDEQVWMRRHRLGATVRFRYGHAFTSWWQRYSREHPEYFNLLPNGKREPARSPATVSMCVSEPAFHRQIVENWLAGRREGGPANVNVCENDTSGLCTCPRCLEWDAPLPPTPVSERYTGGEQGGRVVSNRYARYYKAVWNLAREHDPDVKVVGYAYVNYFPAPTCGIELNRNIVVGLVPDTFFPRSADEQTWILGQWDGWGATGASLFLRPNYFLDGYCMPYVFARQFAEEFGHAARHGMMGTDFDSLTGMWSAQGPNLYVLGRLHAEPTADADEVLSEYYTGFGAAAAAVRAYFDYWAETTRALDAERKALKLGWGNMPLAVHELYSPEHFDQGDRLLAAARDSVPNDAPPRARVEFLQKGLDHARLSVETARRMAQAKESGDIMTAVKAVARLDAFRQSIERDNVANLAFCNWREQRVWDRGLAEETRGKEILAQLPLQWRMCWDPHETGLTRKLYLPETDTSDWLPVNVTAAWEKQAVGEQWKAGHGEDYDGLAWYRTEFSVAPELRNKPLALLFGAVDEGATVWVNGKPVGDHPFKRPEDWYMPFTLDIREAVRVDAPNTVVVLVEDRAGLGGVWKPVLLVSQ